MDGNWLSQTVKSTDADTNGGWGMEKIIRCLVRSREAWVFNNRTADREIALQLLLLPPHGRLVPERMLLPARVLASGTKLM